MGDGLGQLLGQVELGSPSLFKIKFLAVKQARMFERLYRAFRRGVIVSSPLFRTIPLLVQQMTCVCLPVSDSGGQLGGLEAERQDGIQLMVGSHYYYGFHLNIGSQLFRGIYGFLGSHM